MRKEEEVVESMECEGLEAPLHLHRSPHRWRGAPWPYRQAREEVDVQSQWVESKWEPKQKNAESRVAP